MSKNIYYAVYGLLLAAGGLILYLCIMNRSVFAAEVNFDSVWQKFKADYISSDGRVIDHSDVRAITTSEGQSYAMFFALVNNDQKTFEQLLDWTEDNLAQGDLKQHLPAWLWGRDQSHWGVLDSNSASDADLWIAWDLLEAGRLWKNEKYTLLGRGLLAQIEAREVINIPGLGEMLLPGTQGFTFEQQWRLNPSYLPIQILSGVMHNTNSVLWKNVRQNAIEMLIASSPKGFAPDWIEYNRQSGWLYSHENKAISGSYDAIRVYLWLGMLQEQDQAKPLLLGHFQPMTALLNEKQYPPEKINILDGSVVNQGPVGFSAALIPFMRDAAWQQKQLQYIRSNYQSQQNYYNNMLILFGLGWYEKKFRFSAQGQLLPAWTVR